MKDTTKSLETMYARLKKVHKLSWSGVGDTETLNTNDYLFFVNLWTICDNTKEWDNLVIKFKKKNGYSD